MPAASSDAQPGSTEIASFSKGQRCAMRLLKTHLFEDGMGALILLNMVIIIIETDHGVDNDSSIAWVEVFGWILLLVFVVELALRLYVLRTSFWTDRANTVDFVIVVTDTFFSFFAITFGSVFPVSILRVFRLGKLARVSKVFRIFPELRIMMAGLIGSLRSIFWGAVLLAFFLLVWSIIAVQFIHPLNETLTEKGYHENCARCPRAYRSVLESTLTFCQQIVAGDSWGEATIPIIENYPATAFYFMAVFLSVGLAVMNLILGVVVSVAQQETERLKDEMHVEKEMREGEARTHLFDICQDICTDGSGALSEQKVIQGYKDREDFRASLTALNLHEDDIPIVWKLVDVHRSGAVKFTEFVNKVYKMKNKDTSYMLQYMKHYINRIHDSIASLMEVHHSELVALETEEISMLRQFTPEVPPRNTFTPEVVRSTFAPEIPEIDDMSTTCERAVGEKDERVAPEDDKVAPTLGEKDEKVTPEDETIAPSLGVGAHLEIASGENDVFCFQHSCRELKEAVQDLRQSVKSHKACLHRETWGIDREILDKPTYRFEHTSCCELKEAIQDLRQSVKSHEVSTSRLDVLHQKWTSSVDDLLAACGDAPTAIKLNL